MGAWYGNVTVRGAGIDAVHAALRTRGETGWLVEDGPDVVVLARRADAESGGPAQLGQELSAELRAVALSAAVLDSDVLLLWLHVDGEERDAYVSAPDILDALGDGDGDDDEEEDDDGDDDEGSLLTFVALGSTAGVVVFSQPAAVVQALAALGVEAVGVEEHGVQAIVRVAPGEHDGPRIARQLAAATGSFATAGGMRPDQGIVAFAAAEELAVPAFAAAGDDAPAAAADDGASARPTGGDVAAYVAAFPGVDAAGVAAALHPQAHGTEAPLFAEEAHAQLVAALGASDVAVSLGCAYVEPDDELQRGLVLRAI